MFEIDALVSQKLVATFFDLVEVRYDVREVDKNWCRLTLHQLNVLIMLFSHFPAMLQHFTTNFMPTRKTSLTQMLQEELETQTCFVFMLKMFIKYENFFYIFQV